MNSLKLIVRVLKISSIGTISGSVSFLRLCLDRVLVSLFSVQNRLFTIKDKIKKRLKRRLEWALIFLKRCVRGPLKPIGACG